MTEYPMSEQMKFLSAIGYPLEEVEGQIGTIKLIVDGFELRLSEVRGALILSYTLGKLSETDGLKVASFAAGRMLKEEAVVAYDPGTEELILWQKVAPNSGAKIAFELFMTSCEWWKSAIGAEISKGTERKADEFMRIMP